jgi:sugar phosphate isomerase/epimerase
MTHSPEAEIFLSSGAFGATSIGGIVDICEHLGFRNVELSSGLPWSERLEEDVIAASGRCRFLVHNYFPAPREPFVLNLAARDATVLERSREHCRRAIRLCGAVGAPLYSVHAGFAFEVDPSRLGRRLADADRYPLSEALTIFVESLRMLCEYGEARRVGVAVENNVVAPMNLIEGRNQLLLGATAEEMLEIRERVAHPGLSALIDVGHLKVTASALGFDAVRCIDLLAEWTSVFHLSDNDGETDENKMFGPDAWFMDVIRKHPGRMKVVESYGLTVEEMYHALVTVRSL